MVAVIRAVSEHDNPDKPSERLGPALEWYLCGSTAEHRREVRRGMVECTREAIAAFGDRLAAALPTAWRVTVASPDMIAASNIGFTEDIAL